jgi:CDGSH-type Zn-finger protein
METRVKRTTGSRDRTKVLCGCGLSRTFPFCDSSQKIAKTYTGKLVSCGPAKQLDPSHAGTLELTA